MATELIANVTWDDIKLALMQEDLQVGLAGPPGVGKTYGCFDVGRVMKKVTRKIQAHSELSPAECLGMYVPVKVGFDWMPGPIDECYSQGGLLIVDELIEASGPVKTFLHGAFDRGPGGTISYVGRQFIQRPGYQAVATMNGLPNQGGIPEALLDRFDAWFLVTQPTEGQYRLLEPDLRAICRDLYATTRDPMAGPVITFRMLMGVQKMRKLPPPFTLEKAVLSGCYGDKTLANSLLELLMLSDEEVDEDDAVVADATDIDEDEDDAISEWSDLEEADEDDEGEEDDDL